MLRVEKKCENHIVSKTKAFLLFVKVDTTTRLDSRFLKITNKYFAVLQV